MSKKALPVFSVGDRVEWVDFENGKRLTGCVTGAEPSTIIGYYTVLPDHQPPGRRITVDVVATELAPLGLLDRMAEVSK